MNKVCLIGRLVGSASLKYTQTGKPISTFAIAVNKFYKNDNGEKQEIVSYFDITLYGKTAETLQQYLLKGKQVGIDGELKQDRWEKDGQHFSRVHVIADNVVLLGGNSNSQTTKEYSPIQQPAIKNELIKIQQPEFIEDVPIF